MMTFLSFGAADFLPFPFSLGCPFRWRFLFPDVAGSTAAEAESSAIAAVTDVDSGGFMKSDVLGVIDEDDKADPRNLPSRAFSTFT